MRDKPFGLTAQEIESDKKPKYRNIRGTNTKVRVFGSQVEALSTALNALQDCRTVVEDVLGSFTWPIVERFNALHNQLLGKDNSSAEREEAQRNFAAEKGAYDWLQALVESLRKHQDLVQEKLREARNAEHGLNEVQNGQVITAANR